MASALGLPFTTTILDYLGTTASTRGRTATGDETNERTVVQRVLTLADTKYQAGEYAQALQTIETLKQYECVRHDAEVAMDAAIKEAQICMRLNRYPRAMGLVRRIANEAEDRGAWHQYVCAREIENVVLRDQGNYEAATQLARKLLTIAQSHCHARIESLTRSLARSLALNGLCDEAVSCASPHEQ